MVGFFKSLCCVLNQLRSFRQYSSNTLRVAEYRRIYEGSSARCLRRSGLTEASSSTGLWWVRTQRVGSMCSNNLRASGVQLHQRFRANSLRRERPDGMACDKASAVCGLSTAPPQILGVCLVDLFCLVCSRTRLHGNTPTSPDRPNRQD